MESAEHKLKPCIECEKECEIWPVQLGDIFTLTYLRVCSSECMFLVAYDFLYSIKYHKAFRNELYDMQNEEDKALRDEFIDTTTKMFLEDFRKNLEANPGLLNTPIPNSFVEMFASAPTIPERSTETTRFTRPSKEERLQWAKEHVARTCEAWEDALKDLDKIEKEIEKMKHD